MQEQFDGEIAELIHDQDSTDAIAWFLLNSTRFHEVAKLLKFKRPILKTTALFHFFPYFTSCYKQGDKNQKQYARMIS